MSVNKEETFVSLPEWRNEVKKHCIDKDINLQAVSKVVGYSYSTITSLTSGRVVKENYLEIARKINKYLGVQVLPMKPSLPSEEWCVAVRAKLYVTKMSIGQLATETGFSRDRLSLVLNGYTMDEPVIEKINETLKIEAEVSPKGSE